MCAKMYNTVMENVTVDRENEWLTIHEAAEHLGVNPRTVRRYIRLGRLEVSRISNKVVRIRLADIDRFMEGGVAPKAVAEQVPVADPEPVVRTKPHTPHPGRPARPSGFTPGRFG